jgi:hypothetical protein
MPAILLSEYILEVKETVSFAAILCGGLKNIFY